MEKLQAFKQSFGVESYICPMFPKTDFPQAAAVKRGTWRAFRHNHGLYSESFERMISYFADNRVTAVFRGIGGDELGDNDPHLLDGGSSRRNDLQQRLARAEPWLTASFRRFATDALENIPKRRLTLLSPSVAASPLASNNHYLDYNIWPVVPFAHSVLYLYCQSLPMRYRHRKNLMRAYMKARGFPPSMYDVGKKEDFSHFFYEAVRPHLQQPFEQLMNHSVLAKAGLIDPVVAREAWRMLPMHEFSTSGQGDPLFALYGLLSIEANCKALGIGSVL
jgi:hypothetical protein